MAKDNHGNSSPDLDLLEAEMTTVFQKQQATYNASIKKLDSLLATLSVAQQRGPKVPPGFARQVNDAKAEMAKDFKELHSAVTNLGDCIDTTLSPDLARICEGLSNETAPKDSLISQAVAQVIVDFMWREGRFEAVSTYRKELKQQGVDLPANTKYENCYRDVHTLRQAFRRRDLGPCFEWLARWSSRKRKGISEDSEDLHHGHGHGHTSTASSSSTTSSSSSTSTLSAGAAVSHTHGHGHGHGQHGHHGHGHGDTKEGKADPVDLEFQLHRLRFLQILDGEVYSTYPWNLRAPSLIPSSSSSTITTTTNTSPPPQPSLSFTRSISTSTTSATSLSAPMVLSLVSSCSSPAPSGSMGVGGGGGGGGVRMRGSGSSNNNVNNNSSGGVQAAIVYAREQMQKFFSTHQRELESLMGSLLFSTPLPNTTTTTTTTTTTAPATAIVTDSPTKSLPGNENSNSNSNSNSNPTSILSSSRAESWRQTESNFIHACLAALRVAVDNPVQTTVAASLRILPALLKAKKFKHGRAGAPKPQHLDLSGLEGLARVGVFHSQLVCPVSRELCGPGNPPVLLKCGHVVSQVAADRMLVVSRAASFKCPTCPAVQAKKDLLVLYI